MNKEYIKPIISVYEMKPTSQLMFTSGVHNKDANSAALSKGGVFWDDDEPEEVDW